MRYLGIDYGTKKSGIALSDEQGTMAFPHAVVSTAHLLDELMQIINEKDVGTIVMGESKDLTGIDNPVAAQAHAFAKTLTAKTGLPLYFEPELYTTQEAKRTPDGERSRARDVDASAAALILTSFLERQSPDIAPEPEVY